MGPQLCPTASLRISGVGTPTCVARELSLRIFVFFHTPIILLVLFSVIFLQLCLPHCMNFELILFFF
jgi:hypothetical protein